MIERRELSASEQEFVRSESNFINGCLYHKREVAEAMASDHRYLLEQKGELYIEFLKVMAKNYKRGYYDPRNEHVCKAASVAIDALIAADILYIPLDEREDYGMAA
jgi:hypothetical protein